MNFQLIKPVYAVISNPVVIQGQQQVNDPKVYANSVLQTVFTIFLIVAVLYFIWHFVMGGYHWIASEGDSKQIETAKHELTYAFLGLGVVFIVFAVLKVIGQVTGVQGLENLQLVWPSLLGNDP